MLVYFGQQDYVSALKEFENAIERDSNNANFYFNRGLAFLNLNEFVKSIDDFTFAIKLYPNYRKAYVNRAKAFEKLGKKENAKADSDKVKELEKNTITQ